MPIQTPQVGAFLCLSLPEQEFGEAASGVVVQVGGAGLLVTHEGLHVHALLPCQPLAQAAQLVEGDGALSVGRGDADGIAHVGKAAAVGVGVDGLACPRLGGGALVVDDVGGTEAVMPGHLDDLAQAVADLVQPEVQRDADAAVFDLLAGDVQPVAVQPAVRALVGVGEAA